MGQAGTGGGGGGKTVNPLEAGENALGIYHNHTLYPILPLGLPTVFFHCLALSLHSCYSQGGNPNPWEAGTLIVCSIARTRSDIYIFRVLQDSGERKKTDSSPRGTREV